MEAHGLAPDRIGRYRSLPYIDDMGAAYAAADLVVCRAGAGTLAELAAAHVPSVLVPKIGLPHEHQLANARDHATGGRARLLVEEDDPDHRGMKRLPHGALAREVITLSRDRGVLQTMRDKMERMPAMDTATRIGNILETLAKSR